MRLLGYNGLVFVAFVAVWSLIVLIEVKVHPYGFLKYAFFGSLPCVFIAIYVANWAAFSSSRSSEIRRARAMIATLLLAPASILIGVFAALHFKLLIGGHM